MNAHAASKKYRYGTRRKARELTLQFLYQMDIKKGDWKEEIEQFWKHYRVTSSPVRTFALALISGALLIRRVILLSRAWP